MSPKSTKGDQLSVFQKWLKVVFVVLIVWCVVGFLIIGLLPAYEHRASIDAPLDITMFIVLPIVLLLYWVVVVIYDYVRKKIKRNSQSPSNSSNVSNLYAYDPWRDVE